MLWKPELDGVGWNAPFGRGRPGWHIECSAMAKATLGEVIDIHCGGVDLKFPHHENEIAQSCCANAEEKFANYWVHNEFLNMGSEKMSKSLGNVTLVHDLLKEWDGEVIRLALLKASFDSELEWSQDLLTESQSQLDSWYRWLKNRTLSKAKPNELFLKAMFENLNTPEAFVWFLEIGNIPIKVNSEQAERARKQYPEAFIPENLNTDVDEFFGKGFRQISNQMKKLVKPMRKFGAYASIFMDDMASEIKASANLLGLLQKDPEDWFKGGASSDDQAEFDAIALRRQEARAAKDWAAADAARDEATAKGIVLEDKPDGSTEWRKA